MNPAIVLDPQPGHRFHVVNDGVMGGRSSSRLSLEDGALVFSGQVSLDNGGGFASFRGPVGIPPGAAELLLEARGDGRRYKLTLKHSDSPAAQQYQAGFASDGAWQRLVFRPGDFRASFRGRPVAAEPLDFSAAVSLGVLISERQAGPFRLEIRRVSAA